MLALLVIWQIKFAIDYNNKRVGMSLYLDKIASLTPFAKGIICDKKTELPYSGSYSEFSQPGSYLCRRCGLALFRSSQQFNAGCGWPSFDDDIVQAVKQLSDKDGKRTEILCERCEGHLGHVFIGEHFTAKNCRHCVNSASLDFVPNTEVIDTEEAMMAGGCFWGVDHFLKLLPGVLKVEVGYIGGTVNNPSYEQVCSGTTGHYEAVRVVYEPSKINYYELVKRFFEIHDPTQRSGQGPDLGPQYQSAIFYYNNEQKVVSQALIQTLIERGYKVATKLLAIQTFWPAELYHQNYYQKHTRLPYCHRPENRFGE